MECGVEGQMVWLYLSDWCPLWPRKVTIDIVLLTTLEEYILDLNKLATNSHLSTSVCTPPVLFDMNPALSISICSLVSEVLPWAPAPRPLTNNSEYISRGWWWWSGRAPCLFLPTGSLFNTAPYVFLFVNRHVLLGAKPLSVRMALICVCGWCSG